jgi:hypothetical protein
VYPNQTLPLRWCWCGRISFSFDIQKRFPLLVSASAVPILFAEGFGDKEKIAKILLTTG